MALTDVGNVEDELVHSDIDDVQQEITTSSRFLSLHNPPKADASGLPEWISEAMQLLGPGHCSRCRHKACSYWYRDSSIENTLKSVKSLQWLINGSSACVKIFV